MLTSSQTLLLSQWLLKIQVCSLGKEMFSSLLHLCSTHACYLHDYFYFRDTSWKFPFVLEDSNAFSFPSDFQLYSDLFTSLNTVNICFVTHAQKKIKYIAVFHTTCEKFGMEKNVILLLSTHPKKRVNISSF